MNDNGALHSFNQAYNAYHGGDISKSDMDKALNAFVASFKNKDEGIAIADRLMRSNEDTHYRYLNDGPNTSSASKSTPKSVKTVTQGKGTSKKATTKQAK